MSECLSTMCMPGPCETRRVYWIPWIELIDSPKLPCCAENQTQVFSLAPHLNMNYFSSASERHKPLSGTSP